MTDRLRIPSIAFTNRFLTGKTIPASEAKPIAQTVREERIPYNDVAEAVLTGVFPVGLSFSMPAYNHRILLYLCLMHPKISDEVVQALKADPEKLTVFAYVIDIQLFQGTLGERATEAEQLNKKVKAQMGPSENERLQQLTTSGYNWGNFWKQ